MVSEYTRMLSMNAVQNTFKCSLWVSFMKCWRVAAALVSLDGMVWYS